MGGVIIRPEHHGEKLAGPAMHFLQECPELTILPPMLAHINDAPISKPKAANVDRIGSAMFTQNLRRLKCNERICFWASQAKPMASLLSHRVSSG